jgi:hypothetical protein
MTWFMDPMTNARKPSRHRVYLYFMLREGWHCQFLEPDLKTPLPRKLTFATPEKLLEIFERWGESRQSQTDRKALEYAIKMGRGSIWLVLSPEEYSKLKK